MFGLDDGALILVGAFALLFVAVALVIGGGLAGVHRFTLAGLGILVFFGLPFFWYFAVRPGLVACPDLVANLLPALVCPPPP